MSTKRKIVVYPAIFDPSDITPNRYTITFPDVPDAISQGDGFDNSLMMATEALELALFDADEFPVASSIDSIEKPSDDSLIVYIAIDIEQAKLNVKPPKIRKNTTIDKDLALAAEDMGLNISKVLNEALREKLKR